MLTGANTALFFTPYLQWKMKINTVCNEFLDYARYLEKRADSTLWHYKNSLNKFQKFLVENYEQVPELEDLRLADIVKYGEWLDNQEFYLWLSTKKKRKLNHNTKVALITTIRIFLHRCKKSDYKCMSHDLIPIMKQKRNEICYLSQEEILKFFELAEKEKKEEIWLRNQLFFRLAYYTGLRKGEILNLTFNEILGEGQFQVRQKFDRKRTVFFDEESEIKTIARKLKNCYEQKPKNQIYYKEEKDRVFLCLNDPQRGKKRERGGANTVMSKYKNILWIKRKVTIHSFRHTHATTLLGKGVGIRTVQVMLWHATIASTQVYTHISEEVLREAVQHLHIKN